MPIPESNTLLLEELDPIVVGLLISDLLLLSRPTTSVIPPGGDPTGEYKLTLDELRTFILDGIASLDSPTFTGTPSTTTPDVYDNSTTLANTEFVWLVANVIYQDVLDQLTIINNDIDALGRVIPWKPTTNFYASRTVNDLPTAPDIVVHEGSLYMVLQDFLSGISFSEKSGATMVLSRLTLDSDLDNLEIVAGGIAPFWLNQEIGSYIATRQFRIYRTQQLPNDRLGLDIQRHMARCNGTITGPNVISIKRLNANNGTVQTIGTITFDADVVPSGIDGLITFNDANSFDPTNVILVAKGDIITFELTTKTADLTWVRLNLLGSFISYNSPYFDPPV